MFYGFFMLNLMININMRCIEMTTTSDEQLAMALININMRCIEILLYVLFLPCTLG